MKLENLFDLDKLEFHIKNRNVSRQFHPVYKSLAILNYTQRATFERVWDSVTTHTRGLCYDVDSGELVSRCMEKFWNLNTAFQPETMIENLPTSKPLITEKLDGFLVQSMWYDNHTIIASRGSFQSPHAIWAQKFYDNKYGNDRLMFAFKFGYTPVFEGLCSDLRIVIKYPQDELVLLTLIDNITGEEIPRSLFEQILPDIPHVRFLDSDIKSLQADAVTNDKDEGYVVAWSRQGRSPLRVKIKADFYCRLHKLLTGVSAKKIHEILSTGGSVDSITEATPDDFKDWVYKWATKLTVQVDTLHMQIMWTLNEICAKMGMEYIYDVENFIIYLKTMKDVAPLRSEFAKYVKEYPRELHSGLFARVYSEPARYQKWLWGMTEPEGDVYRRDE